MDRGYRYAWRLHIGGDLCLRPRDGRYDVDELPTASLRVLPRLPSRSLRLTSALLPARACIDLHLPRQAVRTMELPHGGNLFPHFEALRSCCEALSHHIDPPRARFR